MRFSQVVLLLLTFCFQAFAQPSQNETPLDRRIVFQKAYELLPSVLEAAIDLALVNNDFTGQEMQTFAKIREVVRSDFQNAKKDRLVFSDDQSIFKIDPNLPIRTAATSSDPKDPIFVNLKVVNDRRNQFEIEDALQILVHEYGHKTTDKVQTVVDSIAAKIRNFLVPYVTRVQSNRGERLTLLSLPTLIGQDNLAQLISGRDAKRKFYLMSALLLQNSERISDLSSAWAETLGGNPMFVNQKAGIQVNSNVKIWQMSIERSTDSEMSFWIEFARDEVASPSGDLTSGDLSAATMARQISADFKVLVHFDPARQSVRSMTYQQSLVPQDRLKAKIEHFKRIDNENYEIGVTVQTPFEFKKAKLLFEGETGHFSVPASYVWPGKDRILFRFKMPRTPVELSLMTRSLLMDDFALLYLDQGLPLKTALTPAAAKPMKLQGINVGDNNGSYPVSQHVPVEARQAKLVFQIESEADLQEIRIGLQKHSSVLSPESFIRSQGEDDPALHGPLSIESKRTDLFFKTFSMGEFTQVRKGTQIEVTLLIPDQLIHLAYRASRGAVGTFFARDEGERSIVSVELVDSQLRTLLLEPSVGRFSYQLISPEHPKSANTLSVFRMEEKPAMKIFCSKIK